ncbi:alpha/beta hydrolase [Crocosphaera sp.]|uniref:alpha/beta fold hydrolase n=1 Tax=Crocosphaera sp. TaxID=2729996 RepID=UPI00261ACB0D|nr:alpha/beta hydrolase [Crocosphaera sp.]MDJ0583435.1 alpha/beta hydrolase [Crocosphaera sp.]
MSSIPTALWLSVSPALHRFNRPLISKISQQHGLALWEYEQTPDEPITLDVALVLLHDYCKQLDHPVHLIGHGLSGWLGMIYAQRYPERVNSLTLLSVGANLGIDWQSHYYAMLKSLPCDRHTILTQIVYSLFGRQCPFKTELLIYILEQDLLSSPSPNTLIKQLSVTPEVISVPLFVLGSRDDMVVSSYQLNARKPWLKSGDVLWECQQGRHFFHYMKPQEVSEKVALFWESVSVESKRDNSSLLSRCQKF